MSETDDFVERLFRNLPKSKPISQIELKQQEKLVLAQIEQMKHQGASQRDSIYLRFQRQFQLVAGFLVATGGLALVIYQSSQSNNNLDFAVKPVSPTNSPSTSPNNSSNGGQSGTPNNSSANQPVDGTQFEIGQQEIQNFINNLGLDYKTELGKIKSSIKLSSSPIIISTIPANYGKCAIELGVNENLLAVDRGTYEGEGVLAFFYGSSRSDLQIIIASKKCTEISRV
jgi:hypothetical protein